MRNKLINGLKILLALTLILGLIALGRHSSDYKRGQQDYAEAEQLANLPETREFQLPASSEEAMLMVPAQEDPYADMLKEEIDLSALKEVNSDVVGWIDIPGTGLSYPVLQGEDNEYYLKHTWKEEANSVGSVFLECQVDPTLADFNTIIYGHRMRDLSMFGSLKYYTDISYWEENPSVYLVIDEEAYRYDIYAAYKADPEDIIYGLKINSRPKKQELIQFGLEHSVIETNITPTTFDRILTLSTCTGSGHASRWVVQAVYRVGASDIPQDMDSILAGTENMEDDFLPNAGDSLIFPDASAAEAKQSGQDMDILKSVLLTGIFVFLVVIEAILFAAAFLYFRSKKKS